MNPSFRLVETYVLSSRNSILLFRAFFLLLQTNMGGTNFKRKTFSCYWKSFYLIFLPEEADFMYSEMYFSTNGSFREVETDFLANANHFLYIF